MIIPGYFTTIITTKHISKIPQVINNTIRKRSQTISVYLLTYKIIQNVR